MSPIISSPGRLAAIKLSFYWAIFTMSLMLTIAAKATPPDQYHQVIERLEHVNGDRQVSITKIGYSVKNRPIFAVSIDGKNGQDLSHDNRVRVLVIAGQHGDERLPVYAALNLIDSLAKKPSAALDSVSVVIVPTVNPDGFVAGRRFNAHGADLNRDWLNSKQPETIAVTQLINRFRPHVLIDQHEWVKDDPYRPNCIETASFGHQANVRLARLLARNIDSSFAASGLDLRMTHYDEQSDPRMAHRRFAESGICSMLVETSPDWPSSKRYRVYEGLVTSVIATLSAPPDPIIANDLSVLKNKRPYAMSLVSCDETASKMHRSSGLPTSWLAFLVASVIVLAKAAAPKKPKMTTTDVDPRQSTSRGVCFSEAVQSDASIHCRLEMMHKLRLRPSDRPQKSLHKA